MAPSGEPAWIDGPTDREIRSALERVAPALAHLPLQLHEMVEQSDPL
jgi:hypothetical protein